MLIELLQIMVGLLGGYLLYREVSNYLTVQIEDIIGTIDVPKLYWTIPFPPLDYEQFEKIYLENGSSLEYQINSNVIETVFGGPNRLEN